MQNYTPISVVEQLKTRYRGHSSYLRRRSSQDTGTGLFTAHFALSLGPCTFRGMGVDRHQKVSEHMAAMQILEKLKVVDGILFPKDLKGLLSIGEIRRRADEKERRQASGDNPAPPPPAKRPQHLSVVPSVPATRPQLPAPPPSKPPKALVRPSTRVSILGAPPVDPRPLHFGQSFPAKSSVMLTPVTPTPERPASLIPEQKPPPWNPVNGPLILGIKPPPPPSISAVQKPPPLSPVQMMSVQKPPPVVNNAPVMKPKEECKPEVKEDCWKDPLEERRYYARQLAQHFERRKPTPLQSQHHNGKDCCNSADVPPLTGARPLDPRLPPVPLLPETLSRAPVSAPSKTFPDFGVSRHTPTATTEQGQGQLDRTENQGGRMKRKLETAEMEQDSRKRVKLPTERDPLVQGVRLPQDHVQCPVKEGTAEKEREKPPEMATKHQTSPGGKNNGAEEDPIVHCVKEEIDLDDDYVDVEN